MFFFIILHRAWQIYGTFYFFSKTIFFISLWKSILHQQSALIRPGSRGWAAGATTGTHEPKVIYVSRYNKSLIENLLGQITRPGDQIQAMTWGWGCSETCSCRVAMLRFLPPPAATRYDHDHELQAGCDEPMDNLLVCLRVEAGEE